MKQSRRAFLASVMRKAWALARQGAMKFGGCARLYFAFALHLVWQDSRNHSEAVYHKGLGNWWGLPGLIMPSQLKSGQFTLPGIGK